MAKKIIFFLVIFLAFFLYISFFKKPKRQTFPPKTFTDIFKSSGIAKKFYAGVSIVDYNNDGYPDILLTGQGLKLYRNKKNNTFEDVTKKVGLFFKTEKFSFSGTFGDFNNDGCIDLYLAGNGRDKLYKNNCDGLFIDVSKESGIKDEAYFGYSASWGDYDNDGQLDLYVANYGEPKEKEYIWNPNILYHNNRNETFTDVTLQSHVSGQSDCAHITQKKKLIGKEYKQSYQPVWFDFNNDRLPDLYVTNDSGISTLYKNNGNDTFTDISKKSDICKWIDGMGIAIGDYNSDGTLDIYVTNTGANLLWKNNGNGTFTDQAAELGISDFTNLGWGTEFFDYDNDGDLDLYVVNGDVPEGKPPGKESIGNVRFDKFFKNNGVGKFKEVSEQLGIEGNYAKRSAAFGDLNNDGFIDAVVVGDQFFKSNQLKVYQNRPNGNNWILLKLIGTKSNKEAVGARVELEAGNKKQIRQVIAGSSFASQNDLRVHFGIGKATHIDEIKILWPSGKTTSLKNIKSNRIVQVKE